ncbi:protein-glucosylgalactosylhydroxylysine glucosidase-like [Ptychodera flava]|uniref:protein-glucosylgalactosylhydroxylysine glucosidase-like n=1 Tax=Ptychodera flava TaxID=63121 RepID=UPI00396A368B
MAKFHCVYVLVVVVTVQSALHAAVVNEPDINAAHRQERAASLANSPKTVFSTESLPVDQENNVDYKYLPTVGNGHIAHVVYTDTLHVNGLYNGKEGGSHRARIPVKNAIRITIEDETDEKTAKRTHSLDVAKGIWTEEILVDRVCKVTMYLYAHQVFSRLLVAQVRFNREKTEDGSLSKKAVTLKVNKPSAERLESDDLRITSTTDFNELNWKRIAVTKTPEFTGQSSSNVYMYYNDIPDKISINQQATAESWHTFILSVDTVDANARKDFVDAEDVIHSGMTDSHKMFLQNHTKKWENTWSRGRIDTDNNDISEKAYTSMYYLMSSLPTLDEPNSARGQFYGVSPDGLANGGEESDFLGHVSPDMEINMFPPILLLHPSIAKDMLSYRYAKRSEAKTAATDEGFAGAKYPYASGFSGRELTTDHLYAQRHYVNGDIAFAARQYLLATRDTMWLRDQGRELMHNAADFWQSRAVYDGKAKVYEITKVHSPDSYPQKLVDNSVYTNAGASQAIWYAGYANCMSGESDVPSAWLEKANKMAELFDHTERYHPAYEGYNKEITVNDADAIMLGYPLQWNMLQDVRTNDLDIYNTATSGLALPMTSAMFAIGYLEIGEESKGAESFRSSYSSNTREPFHIWTNVTFGIDAVNYMSGMGAFLQVLMYGYGGFRLNHEQLDFNPVLPALSSYMRFSGMEFLGSEFDFHYDSANIQINVTKVGSFPLSVSSSSGSTISFIAGETITIPRSNGTISTTTETQCTLPMNRVGGLVSSTDIAAIHPTLLLFLTLVALFYIRT